MGLGSIQRYRYLSKVLALGMALVYIRFRLSSTLLALKGAPITMKRLLLILTLLFSIGAYADTVTSAGSLWYANAGPTASLITNLDGSAFWDNRSYDGFACNVGYFLRGTNS